MEGIILSLIWVLLIFSVAISLLFAFTFDKIQEKLDELIKKSNKPLNPTTKDVASYPWR